MLRDFTEIERCEIFHADRLAIARNVAANGRLFCGLTAAINLYTGNPVLALLAIVPIGASCIVDQIPADMPQTRSISALATYLFAATVLALSILAAL